MTPERVDLPTSLEATSDHRPEVCPDAVAAQAPEPTGPEPPGAAGTAEDRIAAVSVSELLDYAIRARDALDDDTDLERDDVLHSLQVAKAYLCAHELGLVRRSECPEKFLSRDGARRKFDILIQLLRGRVGPPVATPPEVPQRRPKRSTERGEAQAKLIAALTKHHQYADGGSLKTEPIGNNELAKLADVPRSTASAFFKNRFKGYKNYRGLCHDAGSLVAALKLLNGEFAPHNLCGHQRPGKHDAGDLA
jgi:hypothetical protein